MPRCGRAWSRRRTRTEQPPCFALGCPAGSCKQLFIQGGKGNRCLSEMKKVPRFAGLARGAGRRRGRLGALGSQRSDIMAPLRALELFFLPPLHDERRRDTAD